MPKVARVLVWIALGLAVWFILFFVSSGIRNTPPGCAGCEAWGVPWFWKISGSGPGPNPSVEAPSFLFDLVFWLVVSVVLVVAIGWLVSVKSATSRGAWK